jgi:hypothetical protein
LTQKKNLRNMAERGLPFDLVDSIELDSALVVGRPVGLRAPGERVLLLEQHSVPGGQTQTFRRHDWEFATGVHYVSGVGPQADAEGQCRRLLDWLGNGSLQFDACEQARKAGANLMASNNLQGWIGWGVRLLRGQQAGQWSAITLAEQLTEITLPQLRAVLGARWGDYGTLCADSSAHHFGCGLRMPSRRHGPTNSHHGRSGGWCRSVARPGGEYGTMYGLEMSVDRQGGDALRQQSPVAG